MKLSVFITLTYFLVSVTVVCGINTYTFIEEKTERTLSITEGMPADLQWAKEFCKAFFMTAGYAQKSEEEQQNFVISINTKFTSYSPEIFNKKTYMFFIIKDNETNASIGYTIFDKKNEKIYSIETQIDIDTYDIKSLMSGLARFIKERIAADAQYFISAVPREMPQFIDALKVCGYEMCDLNHPSLTAASYQAMQLDLNIAR